MGNIKRRMSIKDKLKKIEHALFESGDHKAGPDSDAANAQRDADAQRRLEMMQKHPNEAPSGYGTNLKHGELSTVPKAADAGIDNYHMQHVEPTIARHHAADNTALRPGSQEQAEGDGTAGDDLAI